MTMLSLILLLQQGSTPPRWQLLGYWPSFWRTLIGALGMMPDLHLYVRNMHIMVLKFFKLALW